MNDFYVYLFLREDGTPYYVGKGKDNRAFRIANRRMKPPSDKSRIIFHAENLTEDQAFALEKELIAKYGRKDNGTGILRNLTDGGEGPSGFIHSDETKAKISAAIKESMSRPEVRAKILATLNTPEVRAKALAAANTPEAKAKRYTPEMKAKRIAARNTPEVRAKQRAAMNTPEVKAKMSQNNGMKRPEIKAKHIAGIKAYYAKKKLEQSASTANLAPFFMST